MAGASLEGILKARISWGRSEVSGGSGHSRITEIRLETLRYYVRGELEPATSYDREGLYKL